LGALASLRRESPRREKSGAAIRNRILRDTAKQDWAYGCDVDVIVRNGIADLWGTISDMAQGTHCGF
jgi:hypothetical protein